jgi:hypothetical protein
MKIARIAAAALALGCGLASASDVLVPAHRTRDGSYVPANVAPNSAGSYLARRPGKGTGTRSVRADPAKPGLVPPLLANAQPVRK